VRLKWVQNELDTDIDVDTKAQDIHRNEKVTGANDAPITSEMSKGHHGNQQWC